MQEVRIELDANHTARFMGVRCACKAGGTTNWKNVEAHSAGAVDFVDTSTLRSMRAYEPAESARAGTRAGRASILALIASRTPKGRIIVPLVPLLILAPEQRIAILDLKRYVV